jgi:bacterioferritin-associated ferredoxin
MVVCSCRAVTDRTVRAALAGGARTVDELAGLCAAATGCGGCSPTLERLIADYARADGDLVSATVAAR